MGSHQRQGSHTPNGTVDGVSTKPQMSDAHIIEEQAAHHDPAISGAASSSTASLHTATGPAANGRLSKAAKNGTAIALPHAALSTAVANINGQAVANKLVAALSSVGEHKRAQKGARREADNGQRSNSALPSGLASGSVTRAFDWGQTSRPAQAAERLVNGAQASSDDASPLAGGKVEGNGAGTALDNELDWMAARRRSSEGASTSEPAGWQQGWREGSHTEYVNGHAVAATNGAAKVDYDSSHERGKQSSFVVRAAYNRGSLIGIFEDLCKP